MANIKFIDRENELKLLEQIRSKDFFLVVKGRRRIGKTTLIRRAFPDATYIFIWPNKSIEWITNEVCKENDLPKFSKFIDVIDYLFEKNKVIILDEFQNFLNVDKSFYGEFQKLIDERKLKNKRFKIITSGSSYSLINKVFNETASPLYGRRTHEITLGELPLEKIISRLNFDIEEFIMMWSVFGGVPYYYEIIELDKSIKNSLRDLMRRRDSLLIDEGKVVLSMEFGKDSKTYSTIFTGISEGKTKLNEIASLFSNKKTATMKYIDLLRKEFNLIKRVTPILSNPRKSKEGIYEINDNFLSFWFYFIDNRKDYIEQERFEELVKFLEENFPQYVGRKFEKFVIYILKKNLIFSDFNFLKIGRQWGRIPKEFKLEKDKDNYEIDVVALNNKKEILFGECKWQDKVSSEKVVKELFKKTGYIDWNKEKRKEYFAIFAKSFSKKIKEFEGKKVYCFDLKDIGKLMRR